MRPVLRWRPIPFPDPSRPRFAAVVLAVVLGLLAVACSDGPPVASNVVPPPATAGERVSFVTLGGSETISRGLDESTNQPWNQQVFAHLPMAATFSNVASQQATVAAGLDEQLPRALAEQPTIATVWFGVGDAIVKTPPTAFAATLTSLVQQLQASGAKVLLIARSQPDQNIKSYLTAVAEVATATGATLVTVEGHDKLNNPAEHGAIASAVDAAL